MISVLVNVYACGPNIGSEPGMGWNWIINLANYCQLHVITEGEWQKEIEASLVSLPQKENITFYYNPVSPEIRRMCWNQGDWRFYYYYKKWQKKTLQISRQIIKEHSIDIVHQLNMIGFREPGYLWKIYDKPFIWGPVGGMFFYPSAYQCEASFKRKVFIKIKSLLNWYQIKYSRRVKLSVNKANVLVSSTPAEYDIFNDYYNINSVIIQETGCYLDDSFNETIETENAFNIIWVGRFIYLKQLTIALKSIARVKHLKNIKFHIIGTGTLKEVNYYKKLSEDLQLQEIVVWHGTIPNVKVLEMMKKSQLFFFTSVAEATSTVVLEALSCNLPVLCFDTCGFGYVINEQVGEKIELSYPDKSVKDFAKKITYLYNNRDVLRIKSEKCKKYKVQFAWDNKARQMVALYNQAIVNFRNKTH